MVASSVSHSRFQKIGEVSTKSHCRMGEALSGCEAGRKSWLVLSVVAKQLPPMVGAAAKERTQWTEQCVSALIPGPWL